MKYLLTFSLFVLLALSSCADDDDTFAPSDCGPLINTVGNIDGLGSGDQFGISSTSVDGLCLSIEVSATGCNTEEWTAELITNSSVDESTPTQTTARFVFDNQLPEDAITCLAILSKTFTFDLSPYLTTEVLPSNLTILGPDTTSVTLLVE
ncbi:MAG: hypothetical protein ACI92C_002306 [Neolewinella sp.]|jgi:hypothetical protein